MRCMRSTAASLFAVIVFACSLEHRGRRALDARVVDDEVRLEVVDDLVAHGQPLDVDRAVGVERHRADAAVGGDVLVLLADGLLQDVDLELARLAGELLGGHELALEGVQAVEQRDGEAARRAEPRVRRHVGQAVELEAPLDARHLERGLEDAVLDLVDAVDDLALRVGEADVVLEARARRRRRRTCRPRRPRRSRRARASSWAGRSRRRRGRSAPGRGRRSWSVLSF